MRFGRRWDGRRGWLGAPGHAEQAQRSLLLEVEGAGGRRLTAADPPAELGQVGPDGRLRKLAGEENN